MGGNGWGNHELEYCTDRPQNSFIQDGNLVSRAARESYTGQDNVARIHLRANHHAAFVPASLRKV